MNVTSSEYLAYDRASARERFVAACIGGLLLAGIAVDVPFAATRLAPVAALAPAIDAIAICAFAATAWMLLAQYRVRPYAPFAILACAFGGSAILSTATLALGWVEAAKPTPAAAQTLVSVGIVARLFFGCFATAYAIVDWRERRAPGSTRPSVFFVWIAAAVVLFVTVLVAWTGRAYLSDALFFPLTLITTVIAALTVLVLGGPRSRLRIWLVVMLIALLGYSVMCVVSDRPYTNAYYVARIYQFIESVTFVFVVQAQIAAILRRARRTGERAHALSEVIAIGDAQTYAGVNAMLARVAREFAFDYVGLARLDAGQLVFESTIGGPGYQKGDRIVLERSIFAAIDSRAVFVIDDVDDTIAPDIRTRELPWKSLCGLQVAIDDERYGTLIFANARVRARNLSSMEREFLRLVGILVGNALGRIGQRKRLDELAYYDALTGLPNRVLLMDRITTAVVAAQRYGGRMAVHFLDLDGFKPINDRFGHAVGDDVLREVARRLERTLRTSDTVGRYGGDEFVVLQPVIEDDRNVADLSARFAAAFREPVTVPAGSFPVSISIGVSIFPEDGKDAHTLLMRADEAQYRVKDARRAMRSNHP